MKKNKIDKIFLFSFLILLLLGFLIFYSASLGLMARESSNFFKIVLKQIFAGFILGLFILYLYSRIDYKKWKKYSFYIFIVIIAVNLLIFIPYIGFTHGGATRWINLSIITFQPSELLKLAMVIYFAAWLSGLKEKIYQFKFGLIPLLVLLCISGIILLLQPDTGTFLVIFFSIIGMYLVAGAKWRDLLILISILLVVFLLLCFFRPYIQERVLTFLNPNRDPFGSGYQTQQSLIAIGSGGLFGRGFGQSVQKFNYLPEPIGDSIFAVAGEEFGFIGSISILFLFIFLTLRGLKIANNIKDSFGKFLAVGIVLLIISQSLINISSMLGVVPLTGLPLVFISHGGTSLLIFMASVGILLNISKHT